MQNLIHEEKTKLSTGQTIRLIRVREESESRKHPDKDDPQHWKIGATHNILVASFFDKKKQKWRNFIQMAVAECCLPESMAEFCQRAKKEIERLLPRFDGVDKVSPSDCQLVKSFSEFAEALQRR